MFSKIERKVNRMITLKILNYTKAEMWALKRALEKAEDNLHIEHCDEVKHCTECPYKRLCIDLDTAKRTVGMKIRERNLQNGKSV